MSFCNIRQPECPVLGLVDTATFTFQPLQLGASLPPCTGITGLAASGDHIYAVLQIAATADVGNEVGRCGLLVLDRRDLTPRIHHVFELARDVHSLWISGENLYAVSTGTDEVLALQLDGAQILRETVLWRPEPEGERQDRHHLNAIYGRGSELLVAGFGKKSSNLWSSAEDGFIFNVRRGEKVVTGIHHPHSLAVLGNTIAYCESRKMSVRVVGDKRAQYLPGYTRGLCVVGNKIFVGTSVGRKVSKSTGVINNIADPGSRGGRCTISCLSVETFEIVATIELDAYGNEIYDLLPIDWPDGPPSFPASSAD